MLKLIYVSHKLEVFRKISIFDPELQNQAQLQTFTFAHNQTVHFGTLKSHICYSYKEVLSNRKLTMKMGLVFAQCPLLPLQPNWISSVSSASPHALVLACWLLACTCKIAKELVAEFCSIQRDYPLLTHKTRACWFHWSYSAVP